jgi:inner membrane protein
METTVLQSVWTKSKLLIKCGIIGIILLILQIPTFYVNDLIKEREGRQKEAIAEVSSKWAGRQNIVGPILMVPYWQASGDTTSQGKREKHLAYFLPDELTVNASVTPQEKYRGIYKVMLYSSQVSLSGQFSSLHPERLGLVPEDLIWNEATIRLGLSDNKGLNDEVKLNLNDSTYTLSPFEADNGAATGLFMQTALTAETAKNIRFSTSFGLNGSEQLLFTPVGKATTVNLSSAWPHPSFTGSSLPQTTAIKDSGFTATWKSLGYKRSFPQQWKDDAYKMNTNETANALTASSFGADLFVPVNSYQKITRIIKYSLLILLLTFAAFFLIETTNKKSAHPFQYGLVGLALVLFYTLLLSFSEYIGFNAAYAISSLATIGLIGWFVKGILESGKLATLLSVVLLLLYSYVFSILQLQDYSLLLGSVGLFITLAVIMRFSKKIQW